MRAFVFARESREAQKVAGRPQPCLHDFHFHYGSGWLTWPSILAFHLLSFGSAQNHGNIGQREVQLLSTSKVAAPAQTLVIDFPRQGQGSRSPMRRVPERAMAFLLGVFVLPALHAQAAWINSGTPAGLRQNQALEKSNQSP